MVRVSRFKTWRSDNETKIIVNITRSILDYKYCLLPRKQPQQFTVESFEIRNGEFVPQNLLEEQSRLRRV